MKKCPLCKTETKIVLMDNEKTVQCPDCGAFQDLNPNSGNVVWMKNGRVVLAEEDVKEQRKKHFKRYGYNQGVAISQNIAYSIYMTDELRFVIRLIEVVDQKVNVVEFNSWEKLKKYASGKTGVVIKPNRNS